MLKRLLIWFWLTGTLIAALRAPAATDGNKKPAPAAESVLILHDASGQYGWIGGLHARMLANLMGHFKLGVKFAPVDHYNPGDIERHKATFYLGTVFDNPLPAAFKREVMATTKPVCWFNFNLWQIADTNFQSKYGFRFDYIDQSGYGTIQYKGESLTKHPLDPALGRTTILNPSLASAPALARQAATTNAIPYTVHAGNFWYVADLPFSFISEEDRYLAFADLLHDILKMPHAENHRAVIRFEDVDPTADTDKLREFADYLHSEGVPFCVAVIPVYVDPYGYYNGGEPETVAMSETPEFLAALKYMTGKGGQIILHGYTHQYSNVPNPYTAVSGDDFEFFRATLDDQGKFVDYQPLPEDSKPWVQGRLDAAQRELKRSHLNAVAWETPHYAASELDYQVFAANFPLTMQRVLYFDHEGRIAGQFYPYLIHRDIYGQKVVPENIGNVEPVQWFNYPAHLPADMIRAAKKARVVRDGWANGYFHPYLDISYLQQIIAGVKAQGYRYVPLSAGMD